MGLKQRGDYRGRATDSGKRGDASVVARPQAQPQMNRASGAPTLQQTPEAAKLSFTPSPGRIGCTLPQANSRQTETVCATMISELYSGES